MGLTTPARYSPLLSRRMEVDPDGDWIRWEDFMDWYYTCGRHEVMLDRENTKLKAQLAIILDRHKGITTQATLAHMAQCMAGLPGPRCGLPRDHDGPHEYINLTSPPLAADR